MNCQKAQRMFGDLADGRLPEVVAANLQRHIAECTDCRVAQHRASRLQQLLAVKRHETPGAEYFDNFLGEFHRRLEAETTAQASWWERVAHAIAIEPVRVWPYGLAGVVGAVMISVALWYNAGVTRPEQPVASVRETSPIVASLPTMVVAQETSTPVLVGLPVENVSFGRATGGAILTPEAVRGQRSGPRYMRYILDRVAVTPASYEARYDF